MMLQIAGDCKGELGMALDNNKNSSSSNSNMLENTKKN